jgi:hypothetical protein
LSSEEVALKATCDGAKNSLRDIGRARVAVWLRECFAFDEPDRRSDLKAEEVVELFITCETTFPLLSLKWGDRDKTKAAETASTFLNAPSITAQVIMDKAAECFSTLKSERGMTIVHFDNVQLRCGIGPDINWGHIVVGHVH